MSSGKVYVTDSAGFILVVVIPFPPAQAGYAATENSLFVRCSAPFSVAAGFIPAIRDPVPTGADELRRYGTPLSTRRSAPSL